ncbi:MAG TPA: hypothetical protein VI318_21980 [Baekduia sp.]
MHLERVRGEVVSVRLTLTELSTLVAGARMALDALRSEPGSAPDEAIRTLERVLADYDAGRERLTGGGQPPREG